MLKRLTEKVAVERWYMVLIHLILFDLFLNYSFNSKGIALAVIAVAMVLALYQCFSFFKKPIISCEKSDE